LLLDEIENHLHPQLITRALERIKATVPQSFVVTHHPHTIFTAHADRVFYFEGQSATAVASPPPKELRYNKVEAQRAPKRSVTTLVDSFAKVSGIYKLFDQRDRHLLGVMTKNAREVERHFFEVVRAAFQPDVAPASTNSTPDRQTQLLARIARQHLSRASEEGRSISVLDIGAGIGRVALELGKLTSWQLEGRVNWVSWETNPLLRDRLIKNYVEAGITAVAPMSLDDVPATSVDLVLMANILHELPPNLISDFVVAGASKLRPGGDSGLVVLEINPLLHPEKYAVAYPPDMLCEILNSSGFSSTHESFPVRDATGYCVFARPMGQPTAETVQKNVQSAWERLERLASHRYFNSRTADTYEEYRATVGDLTTLASMAAWRHGLWR
jgi:SAM-dependent methyltransferase